MMLLFLASAMAATLSGTLRSAQDGSPLADVSVQAYDQQLKAIDGFSDAEGNFVLEGLEPGRWRLRAVPSYRDDHLTRWAPAGRDFCGGDAFFIEDVNQQLTGFDLDLPQGASLSGRLLDGGGSPVPNAVVWATGAEATTQLLAARPALSGADGSFVIRGIDAPESAADGDWWLFVQSEDIPNQYVGPGYEDRDAEAFAVPATAGALVTVGDKLLLDGILVSGTVTGPDGPVPFAEVHVYAGGQVRTLEADASGRYTAVGLPPGDVLPWVNADGLALTYWPDADRPTEFLSAPEEGDIVEEADLRPPAEARIRVRMRDPSSGEPLVGVNGLLYNSTRTVGRGNLTDDDGVLVIDSLHGADYELYVWGARFGFTNGWVLDDEGQNRIFSVESGQVGEVVDITLAPSASLEGVIRDAEGQPVYGATVVARQQVPAGVEGAAQGVVSARDGRYRIEGLPPGNYSLEASFQAWCPDDPGYVGQWWPGQVNPDWATDLELPEGAALSALDLVLALDLDHDGMADDWEQANGLEPWRDDGAEDPDQDGYDNRTEFLLDTDPTEALDGACGCAGGGGAALLVLPALSLFGLRRRREG